MGTGHPLGVYCPRCGEEVVVRGGSVAAILAQALRLRAETGSVGLTCEACGLDFFYNKAGQSVTNRDEVQIEPRPGPELESPHPVMDENYQGNWGIEDPQDDK